MNKHLCGRGVGCTYVLRAVVAIVVGCLSAGGVQVMAQPAPKTTAGIEVIQSSEKGVDVFTLSLIGGAADAGVRGVFYRTLRPVRDARVIEVTPPEGRVTPEGSNRRTQLALWNEVGEDGKLWPHRAIRHGGSHAETLDGVSPSPLGNWEDDNRDGVNDLGFVCIGPIDYRIMLRYAQFNPVAISGVDGEGRPLSPEMEPWDVGEPALPPGLSAAEVPAYDVDGDGVVDETGYMGGGCHLYIVQFGTQALEEYRSELEANGAAIVGFMPHGAYVLRLADESVVERVASLAFVRAITTYHPAVRLDPLLIAWVMGESEPQERIRFNFLSWTRDRGEQRTAAQRIQNIGGRINHLHDDSPRFSATLSRTELRQALGLDEVTAADQWLDDEDANDQARVVSGVDYLAVQPVPLGGFQGQGVRGEVMDSSLKSDHEAWDGDVIQHHTNGETYEAPFEQEGAPSHGTNSFGVVFADPPTGLPDRTQFKGILPMASGKIWSGRRRLSEQGVSRYLHTAELVSSEFQAVFQSNSWGMLTASGYTTVSAELDDIVLHHDLWIAQAQGNQGSTSVPQASFAQAWAKNVVSVGGIYHNNNFDFSDDSWAAKPNGTPCYWTGDNQGACVADPPAFCTAQASIGPAKDGRIKPDLVHFFESVATTHFIVDNSSSVYTCGYGGTSAATPITAGLGGLVFQMWQKEAFPGFGNQMMSVFDVRPHSTTVKALLINTATHYDVSTVNLSRPKTGWGLGNVATLHKLRNNLFIVNEDTSFTFAGETQSFPVNVLQNTLAIKATLVFIDPMGNPSAAKNAVNDIDLRLTSPTGTVYRGNFKLDNSNWSTAGGVFDQINTVENIFVENPTGGTWVVDIIASELNADARIETGAVDADFALVVSGVTPMLPNQRARHDLKSLSSLGQWTAFLDAYVRGDADLNGDGRTNAEDVFLAIDRVFLIDRVEGRK